MIDQSSTFAQLEQIFHDAALHRPMRIKRYEEGAELVLDVIGIDKNETSKISIEIDKFIGGGYAGQVYRVRLRNIQSGNVQGLEVGKIYAMKILIPPSGSSRFFRNVLYAIGFQGPFQLRVNPEAARAGALWQKFIQRGVKIKLGDNAGVVNLFATFVDKGLGSCGELSEWVEGRTWRLEVDDRIDLLRKWSKGKKIDEAVLGSPEFRAKRIFMKQFVELLHEMGAHEFARQYEWSTWKSQPNCLKKTEAEDRPDKGLVAVDFRAGLALLPFLPMSPGDFKLILQGISRGSLVQFDRGDLKKLEHFTQAHKNDFSDMQDMWEELKADEHVYRNSVPDITHNHIKILYSGTLWSTLLKSSIQGWSIRGFIDNSSRKSFQGSRIKTVGFLFLGLIPFLGKFFRRIWGHADWRKHYGQMFTSGKYLRRAIQGKMAESLIHWQRNERVTEQRALVLVKSFWRFCLHAPLSILPPGLHRFMTDLGYVKSKLAYILVRPVRLYFNQEFREQWLLEMLSEGKDKQLLSQEDACEIESQVQEPYIQKYLKCLAVHVCTLPITQVVSVIVAVVFMMMNSDLPPKQAWLIGFGIIAAFQITPVSPGSLVRGLYVLYLVIRERNYKDYNIAVFLGFFKYVGYLAFPIQMAYRYPTLARFMASHWATSAVHIVPVFGERGALLEHKVYSTFYNYPLTIRRRIQKRSEFRSSLKARYWHIVLCGLLGAAVFGYVDYTHLNNLGTLPGLKEIWALMVLVPLLCGAVFTLGAGGARLGSRVIGAAVCGVLMGILCTVFSAVLDPGQRIASEYMSNGLWRVFIFTLLSTLGALLTELKLPEPKNLKAHPKNG